MPAMLPFHMAQWVAAVQQPPIRPRKPLWLGCTQVGSADDAMLERLAFAAPGIWQRFFQKEERKGQYGYVLRLIFDQNPSAPLADLAQALYQGGCSGAWRHELLPVLTNQGHEWARVERAVVRVLGLRTQAVHLVGRQPSGDVWLQLRSFTKPNDPGQWDTLMGGTVSAGETVSDTLARETWEEAGLRLGELTNLKHGGRFTATRPVPDGGGSGYLVEDTDWYTVTVPEHFTPFNQDGEVDHFELWPKDQVLQGLHTQPFTAEARWVLAHPCAL